MNRMVTFGRPDNKSDEDVLEALTFWEAEARKHDNNRDYDLAAQCRGAAADYRAEAEKRGLL